MKHLKTFESYAIFENRKISDSWQQKFTSWANKTEDPELAKNLMVRYWDVKNHPDMEVKYRDFNYFKTAKELEAVVLEMEETVSKNKSFNSRGGFYKRNPGGSLKAYNLGLEDNY